ncbi:hypothetical protein Prum_013550 [Phytohabitans rumicis]|uniref:CBM2 domain-containing protein n=1 Tax=Phytohabitans rumicis TaxID=1076125 RepID=A0A6V8KRD3_9ACTN|nr:hypothetical protein Prum_013550 [Phytohabitans rumicis]
MQNKRFRLGLAATLVAAVSAVGVVTAVSAQAAAGCRVTYTVTNSWPGGFGANVVVDNLGDPINGWRLSWSFGGTQTITQLWNGSHTQSGQDVTVTNASWNGNVPTSGSANFGFNASMSGGTNAVPASFSLNGAACNGSTGPTTGPPTSSPPTSAPPTSVPPTSQPPTSPPPGDWPPSSTFNNPVLWQDFADIDIIRVGDAYYYSASTMHYSPGAPILRSYDLVNWEFAGHSVPSLDFDSNAYNLSGGRAYVKGIWASAFNYRPSNRTFYWIGCTEFNRTYVYTATSVEGPWAKRSRINGCYYDAGLLVDDNDTMYVAYGNSSISVAQLSADGLSQVRSQQVFQTPPVWARWRARGSTSATAATTSG